MGVQREPNFGYANWDKKWSMPQPHQSEISRGAWQNYRQGSGGGGDKPLPLDHERQRKFKETGVTRGYHSNRPDDDNTVQFGNKRITPIQKDLYWEHPSVSGRSTEQCANIRAEHGIKYESVGEWESLEGLPKLVKDMEEAQWPKYIDEFLKLRIWKAIFPIQMQAWPALRRGHDLIASAPTGSGKTMSYLLPLVCHVFAQKEVAPGEGPISIIILPSRELCKQVESELSFFGSNLHYEVLVGGEPGSLQVQIQKLRQSVDVAIVTPGRMMQLLEGKHTNLDRATFFVLDEADMLLAKDDSGGMHTQVEWLFQQVRPDRQIVLCSATLHEDDKGYVAQFVKQHLQVNPVRIMVGPKLAACKDVEQSFIIRGMMAAWPKEKGRADAVLSTLQVIREVTLQAEEAFKVVLFCNGKDSIEEAVTQLRARNFMVKENEPLKLEAFHSDKDQARRTAVLEKFRDLKSDVHMIVGSQALARGHDFPDLKFVINWEYPSSKDGRVDYIHRIGRTGRGGNKGWAVTLLDELDLRHATDIKAVAEVSGQNVPAAIAEAATKKKRQELWQRYDKARGQEYNWTGRGKDYYRKKYLQECAGLGAARPARTEEEST